MKLRIALAVALLLATALFAHGANAGGWASVRLATGTPAPVAGQPWQAELIVRQHDITEIDVDTLTVRFTHQESGTGLDVTGVTTGVLGHYRIEVTFDRAGVWNWTATPVPFGPSSLPSLSVSDGAAATPRSFLATLATGGCTAPESSFGTLALHPASDQSVVAFGITAGLAYLAKYTAGGPAVVLVADAAQAGTPLACGVLPRTDLSTPVAVTLDPLGASTLTGVLTLQPGQPDGADVWASLVLFSAPAATGVVIRITDQAGGIFSPAAITVPAGTSVTWINESTLSHSVVGNGDGFLDSGMLAPGERFTQTLGKTGEFPYHCNPHTNMTGRITIVN